MRKTVVLILFINLLLNASAQQKQLKIDVFALPEKNNAEGIVIIEVPYAGSSLKYIVGDTLALNEADQITIDVVCSDYPSNLSLEKLNENRLNLFYKLFPSVDKKKITSINFWRQLNGDTRKNAEYLFHGLVIRYRHSQTAETMKHDLIELELLLFEHEYSPEVGLSDTIGSIPSESMKGEKAEVIAIGDSLLIYPPLFGMKYWGFETEIKEFKNRSEIYKDADTMIIMTPEEVFQRELIPEKDYEWLKKFKKLAIYFRKVDYYDEASEYMTVDSMSFVSDVMDSTVFNVLSRNKWKNISVTGDVTGSMYPYTAQLLIWLKLHSLDSLTRQFTFFNDGDSKMDNEKIIGSTGGIYSMNCKTFEEVRDLIENTMSKGGGGDAPENNIEALLATEKMYPNMDYHVMIADNWAPIKDKELINQLRKPVRVVLCGVYNGKINVDYLNLARKTGGSLHLMEEDLEQLGKLHDGETIKIGSITYKLVNGNFIELNSL